MPPNPEQVDLYRPDGCKFGLGLARGFVCLLRFSIAWRLSSIEPVGPVKTIPVQGLSLGLPRGL